MASASISSSASVVTEKSDPLTEKIVPLTEKISYLEAELKKALFEGASARTELGLQNSQLTERINELQEELTQVMTLSVFC